MLCNCEDWLTVLCLVMSGLAHMTTIHYSTFNLLLNVVAETEPLVTPLSSNMGEIENVGLIEFYKFLSCKARIAFNK